MSINISQNINEFVKYTNIYEEVQFDGVHICLSPISCYFLINYRCTIENIKKVYYENTYYFLITEK